MEKQKIQEAVAEWRAEKRRRDEDVDQDGDDEDVQDVQVRSDSGGLDWSPWTPVLMTAFAVAQYL